MIRGANTRPQHESSPRAGGTRLPPATRPNPGFHATTAAFNDETTRKEGPPMNYLTRFARRRTSQRHAIPGTNQVPNSAGGFAWAVDDWARLRRFLILG